MCLLVVLRSILVADVSIDMVLLSIMDSGSGVSSGYSILPTERVRLREIGGLRMLCDSLLDMSTIFCLRSGGSDMRTIGVGL